MLKLLRDLLIIIGRPVYFLFSFPFALRSPSLKFLLKSLYPIFALCSLLFALLTTPRTFSIVKWTLELFIILIITSSVGIYYFVLRDLPSPKSLSQKPPSLTTHIRDRNGVELFKIYRSENRTLIPLADMPISLRQAIISIEDAGFYSHPGFSVRGILRALSKNTSCALSTVPCALQLQGGSTITQQLVKSALLSPEQTLRRKIRELVLSLLVERLYTKDQILEMYLNRVSFGGPAYGVEEASQTYFGKSVTQLNLAESAFLAGLPASPTTFSPYGAHPELAKARQKEVLRRMVAASYITWEKAESVSLTELTIRPPQITIQAPHFVMYIRELLTQKYGQDFLEQGGLDVITSLDLSLQNQVQRIVTAETARVAYLRVGNGAALVTNPQTGEILAMVGSRDYFDLKKDGNVNVTLMSRQPGSSIKPVNYALAFTRGFTPSSIIEDSPITYRTPGQPPYSPVNYDRRYHGRVTLRSALANSYNIPAVKLLSANGVTSLIDLGRKMGITTWEETNRFGLSLTLGGGEVTMLDMAQVYGTFATLGLRTTLHSILAVRDSQGHLLEEFRCPGAEKYTTPSPKSFLPGFNPASPPTEITSCTQDRVLDPKIAYLISDILSDNAARTPVFGPRSDLFIPNQAVAAKTGTTNNLRDNWTIGYTANRAVVVWVGNNDNSPMSYVASGITGASPIWRKIMDTLLASHPHTGFTPPPDLLKVSICTITGELACSGCPSRSDYFVPGTQPKTACNPDSIRQIIESRNKDRDKLLDGAQTTRTP